MTEAEQYLQDNAKDVSKLQADVKKASASSESLSTINVRFEDGSLVVAHSFQGSDGQVDAFASGEDVPTDLSLRHVSAEEAAEARERAAAEMDAFRAEREAEAEAAETA